MKILKSLTAVLFALLIIASIKIMVFGISGTESSETSKAEKWTKHRGDHTTFEAIMIDKNWSRNYVVPRGVTTFIPGDGETVIYVRKKNGEIIAMVPNKTGTEFVKHFKMLGDKFVPCSGELGVLDLQFTIDPKSPKQTMVIKTETFYDPL